MTKNENIPAPAVRRLSFYVRQLDAFFASGHRTVSSRQLGEALSLSDAQVRKDLAYFGQFGHPGVGYRVPELIQRLREILGTDKPSNVLLVGVGNLGRALLAFRGFQEQGFRLIAAFDKDTTKIGQQAGPSGRVTVQPLAEMEAVVRRQSIRIGILAVPGGAAQTTAEVMVQAGIRGILNFAPIKLQVGPEVSISSVDLGVHLEQLSFQLNGGAG